MSVVYNGGMMGFTRIPHEGPVLGDHRIYFGSWGGTWALSGGNLADFEIQLTLGSHGPVLGGLCAQRLHVS